MCLGGPVSTYGEQKKAWAREWAQLRAQYLDGRLPEVLASPVPGDPGLWWWECPACRTYGQPTMSEVQAASAGRGHAQTHVTDEDSEYLEDLKVTRMPPQLLTAHQRRRREQLEAGPPGR